MSARWKVLSSRKVYEAGGRFTVSIQRIKLPDGRIVKDYYQIWMPESAIIIARTAADKVVLCRQYRHGIGAVSLVAPAGTGEPGETTLQTAKRELLEETGYSGGKWRFLGDFALHANYGSGTVAVFLADGVKRTAEPVSDDLERTEVVLKSRREIAGAVKSREMVSMGTIASLSLAKYL